MKNRILKLVIGAIVSGLFIFNMLFSFDNTKSVTTLSSLITTAAADPEDPNWEDCWWKGYMGGNGEWFFFCQYDPVAVMCTPCGSFM